MPKARLKLKCKTGILKMKRKGVRMNILPKKLALNIILVFC